MAIFEYYCPECRREFNLMRPIAQRNDAAACPDCNTIAKRIITGFSYYTATPSNSPVKEREKMADNNWYAQRKYEDKEAKNPDVFREWRKEREKACGKGPEAWTEWANEEKAKEQKKKTYGKAWLGWEA